MTYYSYLSRQRSTTIAKVNETIVQIEQTQVEIDTETERLADLETEATEKLEEIKDSRAERAALVRKISSSIESKDTEIDRLQSQADELTKLVKALARVVPPLPPTGAKPFAGQAERLTWPVDGRVLKNFGTPRADGRLKWEGVLLGAPAGSAVRSVFNGRVVFAEWLAGLGLLAIVDHGGGYMTLYGHNQALLKDVGDQVKTGESIALVGDSGGQTMPALYFEIRKDGKPVNPASWIR
jgi:septal ring factor EnvC (AmiA/AmiB activator)